MRKKDWSNAVWLLFHTLAEKLRPEFCPNEVPVLFDIFFDVCNNLPCPECQGHAVNSMRSANKRLVTASRENLIKFMWEFHNSVNRRLKLAEYPFDQLSRYKLSNTPMVVKNFMIIMSRTSGGEKLMTNTFHRKMYLSKLQEYLRNNSHKYAP